MADLIDRGALVKHLDDIQVRADAIKDGVNLRGLIELIGKEPTIDAAPVVWCHECDLWEPFGCKQDRGACDEWSDYEHGMTHYTGRNEFCGRGKPRVEHEDFAAKRMDADAPERVGQGAQPGGEVRRDG